MSATIATIVSQMNAREVFTAAEAPLAANDLERTAHLNGLAFSQTLSANSVPKIDKPPVYKKITSAGTATIDLTAAPAVTLPGGLTRAVDLSGAKVRGLVVRCGAANAGVVTIAPGAANPYPLFGTGNALELGAAAQLQLVFRENNGNLPAVSGTVKNLDITTTGSDEVEIELLAGT